MDLNKLPTDTAIDVLKWCKKNNLTMAKIGELVSWCEKNKVTPVKLAELFVIIGKQKLSGKNMQIKHNGPPKPTKKNVYQHDYRELRKKKGKSQEQVAEEVPINIFTLRRVELKKGGSRKTTLDALNTYYGVE